MSKIIILITMFAGAWFTLNSFGFTNKVGNVFGYDVSIAALVALAVCILFAGKIR